MTFAAGLVALRALRHSSNLVPEAAKRSMSKTKLLWGFISQWFNALKVLRNGEHRVLVLVICDARSVEMFVLDCETSTHDMARKTLRNNFFLSYYQALLPGCISFSVNRTMQSLPLRFFDVSPCSTHAVTSTFVCCRHQSNPAMLCCVDASDSSVHQTGRFVSAETLL